MNRKALAAVLVVPLLAAVVYALWPVNDLNATPPLPISGEGRGEGRTSSPPKSSGTSTAPLIANREVPNIETKSPTAAPIPTPAPQLAAPSPAPRDSSPTESASPEAAPPAKSPPHTLDREGIRSAIREKLPEMQDCYESWLQQNPELGGTVALSFQVVAADGGGMVQNLTIVDGGVGHRAFEGCVGNVFNELDFEEPRSGPMNVTYPVMFSNNPAPP